MTLRRTGTLVAVVIAVVALGACQPLAHPPLAVTPAPAGAALSVSTTTVARLGSVTVTATGCDDDFQFVEVRLVSGSGDARSSSAVATGWAGEPTPLTVPAWTPSGSAVIEASCLEPNFSGGSDGADVVRFDYAPVPITVAPYPQRQVAGFQVPPAVSDGVLRVSGSDCAGRVLVSVARGPWQVASAANFHYGRTLIDAEPDGSWSATIPLRYSVGSFDGAVAPGTMTAFAVCDGEYYPATTFEVVGSAPAIELVGPGPAPLYLSQCPEVNEIGVIGIVELAGGGVTVVAHTQAGTGYGETFVNPPVPDAAVAVTWYAGCHGAFDPSFTYQAGHWAL